MAVVLVPSLVAAQAGGKKRFEVEAGTVGEALRGLPVSDLLLDERGELLFYVPRFLQAHEQPHVPAHAVLLVDHPELQAGEAAVEVVEHAVHSQPLRRDPRRPVRVGRQLRGDQHLHHGQSGAAARE